MKIGTIKTNNIKYIFVKFLVLKNSKNKIFNKTIQKEFSIDVVKVTKIEDVYKLLFAS